jgi:transcriptional regulator with XRE-family HTH domain|nr:MAG TPA: nucleoid-associated protein [Caudoviricetes sp.]
MQTINDRIRMVLERSGKTKTAFGESLNVSQQYISKLVKTGNPSELLINDICEKYHIRKEWLVDGTGDPGQPLDRQDEIAKLTGDLFKGQKNSFKERLILALSRLDESEWEVLEKIAEEIAKEKD